MTEQKDQGDILPTTSAHLAETFRSAPSVTSLDWIANEAGAISHARQVVELKGVLASLPQRLKDELLDGKKQGVIYPAMGGLSILIAAVGIEVKIRHCADLKKIIELFGEEQKKDKP